jgi:uncharacterized SAM-binding protein YcdF (DUF218 family)
MTGAVPPELAADLNLVAEFLALRDLPALEPAALAAACGQESSDCLVLLGSGVLACAEEAFRAMQRGVARLLVVSGGLGHSTSFLREAVARHPRYRRVATAGRPEAEILGELAQAFFGLEPDRLVLETASTNCGENAVLTRAALEARGSGVPRTLVLVQDPTMQRRSDASFRLAFRDLPGHLLLNHPAFVPRLGVREGRLAFEVPPRDPPWPVERFASLVVGEIPRLRDDAEGYGPRGRGFIAHVDIPGPVEAAHARLASALSAPRMGRPGQP